VAKTWEKIEITTKTGEKQLATAPVIISASRATDIPAFYADLFIHRLNEGHLKWKNPFNNTQSYVSFKNTRLIVFWSKNPKPMIKFLPEIDKMGINYYFQYTLNDYDNQNYESNVPPLKTRIETFKQLAQLIGKQKVIWRFDPLLLTDKISVLDLLQKIKNIGDQLQNYTNKLVISFADIKNYSKVIKNLTKENINYIDWTDELMLEFATELQKLNKTWNFEIGTCAEKIALQPFGIVHNKCIDDDLMIKLFETDKKLMDFLDYKPKQNSIFATNNIENNKTTNLKDKGQREFCGCIMSKDIGSYNTCPHGCVYCYANSSKEIADKNYEIYRQSFMKFEK